jgi:uncharacterized protein YjdB
MAAACIAASMAFGQGGGGDYDEENEDFAREIGTTGPLTWKFEGYKNGYGGTLTISGTGYMPEYFSSNDVPWKNSYGAYIKDIIINEGVVSISTYAFSGAGGMVYTDFDLQVSLPSTLTEIGGYAFASCPRLKQISLPDLLILIDRHAFSGCSKLTNVNIPPKAALGMYAFNGCSELTQVAFLPRPEIKDIPNYAFANCTKLKTVVIGENVNDIGSNAFSGSTAITQVINLSALPQVLLPGDNVFYQLTTANVKLFVPAQSLDAYRAAFVWKDFNVLTPLTLPAALAVEETYEAVFDADYAGIKTVSWFSDNPAVAAPNVMGEMKGISVGSASIMATTTDGWFKTFRSVNVVKGKVAKPVAVNRFYNGEEQTAGVSSNVYYTITGDIKGTNANTYTATVALSDKTNYAWADGTDANLTITWTIAKANPEYTAPTGLTAKVGQTLAEVALPAGWTWMTPAAAIAAPANEQTHKAKFTPEDVANYNAVDNIDVKIAVSEAGGADPIRNIQKSDGRFGIKFTSGNIVSDKAEFAVILPDNDRVLEVKAVIYDNTGNVVFETSGRDAKLSWN